MTRSLAPVLALLLASSNITAQEKTITSAQHGRAMRIGAPMESNSDGTIPVIVEFTDVPLVARNVAATSTAAAFDARFATFARDLAQIERTREVTGITRRFSALFAGVAADVAPDAIPQIQALSYVRGVHPDRTMRALVEEGVPKIQAPQAWSLLGTRGANVIVAIVDSGVDYTHPALGGGFGPGKRVSGGADLINNDADPMDDNGHGTHVAGIVGGNGEGITGVAPDVTFLAYKVLNAQGAGKESVIIAGVERAVTDHANIINLSLGGPGTLDDPLTKAVDAASAAGVIVCVAAGNDGAFADIGTPANAASAITVGASSDEDVLADFSSKGPVVQSLSIKPEVVAPGVDITSAAIGGGTLTLSGTSMAAPHVSGVAALLRAVHPNWPVSDIKAAIVGTARALGGEAMAEGAGRLDALSAATADVIAAQSVLSFGGVSIVNAHWTSTATLTLVNHGSASRTVTLDAPSPRSGIAMSLDVTSVAVPAGASRDVHLTVDVDNKAIPAPPSESLSFSGIVSVTGGAAPLRVPWAIVKGAAMTLDYDSTESYEAVIVSGDGATAVQVPQTSGRYAALVPNGVYDIEFASHGISGPERLIIIEQQRADDSVTVPVHRASAVNKIVLSAQDETGAPLETGRDCAQSLALLAPVQRAEALTIVGSRTGYLISPVSDRFTLSPIESCSDSTPRKAYTGQFQSLKGVNASQTLSIQASDWSAIPVRVKMPDNVQHPHAVLLTGWSFANGLEAASSTVGLGDTVTTPFWSATLFATASRNALINTCGEVQVYNLLTPFPFIDSPPIRRSDAGPIASKWESAAPSTYVARPGEPLMFGDGLLFVQTVLLPTQLQTVYLMQPKFRGMLDEDRGGESSGSNAVLRNGAGNTVGLTGVVAPRSYGLDPGPYDYTITKPVSLNGIDGSLNVHAHLDASQIDLAPPSLTSLRLLDEMGRVTSSLLRGNGGTLQFTALDFIPKDHLGNLTFAAIRADSVVAQWRPHGATNWSPLSAKLISTEIANSNDELLALGHPGFGSLFRADLTAASQSTAAAIDLSIRFEDAAGNSYEWSLSPAVALVDASHRRAASH